MKTQPKQTAMQKLISELENIKKTKCKTLKEVVFFDGVLAIIESKYLPEERKEIEEAFNNGACVRLEDKDEENDLGSQYFTTKFKQ